jgi:hypothetical protein
MNEQLLQLRRESYKAAADYHRAMEQWQTVSRAQEKGAAVSAYLLTLEPIKLVTEEIGRVLKLQDLLDREIKLIF